jgi:hypothetical protein
MLFCPLGSSVPWTMHTLDHASFGRCFPWTKRPWKGASNRQCVPDCYVLKHWDRLFLCWDKLGRTIEGAMLVHPRPMCPRPKIL